MTVDDSLGNPITVPTKVEDNTQCLACHAGKDSFAMLQPEDLLDMESNRELIAEVSARHSFHAYDPEDIVGRSRCTECHMAKVAKSAEDYDISSHTFAVIRPEQTLATQAEGGMPNSCAVRCHRPWAPIFGLPLDSDRSDWSEPADVELAEWLKQFYGPGGTWWTTEP